MTLDELSKVWLEKQKFNRHFYECAGKWHEFANQVAISLLEKLKQDGYLDENFKIKI